MRVLLIDNETRLLDELMTLIPGNETVRRWDESYDDHREFDVIVLSGGSSFSLESNVDGLAREIALVKETTKPVIGVCLGAEIIAYAFGGTLKQMKKEDHGPRRVSVLSPHPVFRGLKEFSVNESHRFAVDVLPETFELLASSSCGPEMFRHRSFPIFGMQFHPESVKYASDGRDIFLALLNEKGVF